jgi:hypothetical protein
MACSIVRCEATGFGEDISGIVMDSATNAFQLGMPTSDEFRWLLHKYRVLISQLRLASDSSAYGDCCTELSKSRPGPERVRARAESERDPSASRDRTRMLVDQGKGPRRTGAACTDCGGTRARRSEGNQTEVRSGRRGLQDLGDDDFLSNGLAAAVRMGTPEAIFALTSSIDRERMRCATWAGDYNRHLERIRPPAPRKGPPC